MSLNPITLTKNIRDGYIRYLISSLKLKDPVLRESFYEEVKKFGYINGPILESTPPFEMGCTFNDLVEEGLLSKIFNNFIYDALPYLKDKNLYLHQEKSIRKVINDRNIIVAAGTGSGKTECFLVPIYNYLINKFTKKKLTPGVHALLLYPMNALVNDQLNRLRSISRIIEENISELNITFGRYVGDTKEEQVKALEMYKVMHPGEEPVRSEILSREEMRENPPNILITNYAMLEYLLLRPKDSPFFDGELAKFWKFLVLDEAHIYSGATGIEIAMLVRRLKDRVCKNITGDLTCIATSATLTKEIKELSKITDFASKLFGEEFEWNESDENKQDAVISKRVKTEFKNTLINFPLELYEELNEIISISGKKLEKEDIKKIFFKYKISKDYIENIYSKNKTSKQFLYDLLESDSNISKLKDILNEGAKDLKYVVEKLNNVNGNENNYEKLLNKIISLINVAVWARLDKDSLPLFPARYHLFVRATEGVFVTFYPKLKIFLDRKKINDEGFSVFEIATCRRCGQEYIVGDIIEGKLEHALNELDTERKNRYFILEPKQDYEWIDDEDQEIALPSDEKNLEGEWKFCIKCGEIWNLEPTDISKCLTGEHEVRYLKEVTPNKETLNKCISCGLRSEGIVREFIFRKDAPTAVLATSLYQSLESDIENKKILAFSDSRQDAAFFAPYLDFTYKRILFRRLFVEVLKNIQNDSDYRIDSLCEDVEKIGEKINIFDGGLDDRAKIKEIWKWIIQEFCGLWDRRNSLEGVGLLSLKPVFPKAWSPPVELKNLLNITNEEIKFLYIILLNSLRYNTAITFPEFGPDPKDDFFYPRNRVYRFRNIGSDIKKGIYSFINTKGRNNTRSEFVQKLLKKIGKDSNSDNCVKILNIIWSDIRDNWTSNGLYQYSDQKEGTLFQLDYRYWRIFLNENKTQQYICNKCGLISDMSIKGVCPVYNCDGTLKELDLKKNIDIAQNHYRYLYRNLNMKKLTSHEHTAQLSQEKASKVQQDFIEGKIDLLSCSTTFELGVDLGELELIFLRNIPPEPSNYIQRTGRAGRRTDNVGFNLTFAQLRSHDLSFFKEPEKMVDGVINAPVVELTNEKIIKRHLYSIALSHFFRGYPIYYGNLDSFFGFMSGDSATSKIKDFLYGKPKILKESIKRVLPSDIESNIDLDNWNWIENLIGNDGALTIADEKIRGEVQDLRNFYNEREQAYSKAKTQRERNSVNYDMDWADKRLNTIKKSNLIDFLANNMVIPKYGFPADVVELTPQTHLNAAKEIRLERDLRMAISEFAPGAEVIANGFIWESAGIKLLRNRAWPIYNYAICPECNKFYIKRTTIESKKENFECDDHGQISNTFIKRFIVPLFGFTTSKDKDPKKSGESRLKKEYVTRPYFFSYKNPKEKEFKINDLKIVSSYSTNGELAVICKGKKGLGFSICFSCGSAFPGIVSSDKHKTPFGKDCTTTLSSHLHLGHTFQTDVIILSFPEVGRIISDRQFWLSLLYAIIEGTTDALNIKRQELDGCLYQKKDSNQLIIFDNIPGGAGHVKRIIDQHNLKDIILFAKKKLENCNCGLETSCYGCLRNYQNQYYHHLLSRGSVLNFLSENSI